MNMENYNSSKETLYNGSKLTHSTFNDFVTRLKFHCRGEGVSNHHTAEALFIVQTKRMVTGLMSDFTDNKCIHDGEDSETFYSLESFIENLDDDTLKHYELNDYECPFLEMSESDQWDALENISQLTISGFDTSWEYVNCHLTKEAAQRFIERKQHDHMELRIYVDSQYWAWEFNTIKNAILDGRLVLKDE
jgi:hypothetical protein